MGVEKLRLKDNHTWKSKAGYSICVLDRGLVRFDYPNGWIVEPDEGAVHLHDQPPSVESCDLGVSIFRVPAELVQDLSLDDTLRDSLGEDRKPYEQSETHHIARGDLEIAWLEQRYVDTEYNRDARFRVALARGSILCLISMNYWSNRAAGLESAWDEVLRTLVIGVHVEDPTAGPVVQ
ncbi:MAG TPA: hypothetical protein VLW65_08365 [Bryobacteraceae bacterium]|nr:hypothetical protein [Bryobacteraceae bacterium]